MTMKKADVIQQVDIQPLVITQMSFRLVGTTPLIMNRQSEKMKHELMLPAKKLNRAAREQVEKHNPYEEYQAAAYVSALPSAKSFLHMPGGAFKRAITEAAIDIPGAAKAVIGRLVSLASTTIDVYGKPYVHFAMVRQGGMTKTPDTRFRCVLPEWACEIKINFVSNIITATSIANLVNGAGIIRGIGDGRVEKGALDFGQFVAVPEDDEEWHRIVNEQGRAVQKAAWETPVPYDRECADMLEWYDAEIIRRRSLANIPAPSRRRKGELETTQ